MTGHIKTALETTDTKNEHGFFIQSFDCSINHVATIQDVADYINDDTGYYVMRLTYVPGDWQIILDSKTDRIVVQGASFDEVVEKVREVIK